jgi:hypothetical protein
MRALAPVASGFKCKSRSLRLASSQTRGSAALPAAAEELFDLAFAADFEAVRASADDAAAFVEALGVGFVFAAGELLCLGGIAGGAGCEI